MATIAEIEQQLKDYSASGNSAAFLTTLNSILDSQKASINPFVYGIVFTNLSNLAVLSTAATMTTNFMLELGGTMTGSVIGSGMLKFATAVNYQALAAVTARTLTQTQIDSLKSSYNLDYTLDKLATDDNPARTVPIPDAQTNSAVANLMTKLGAHVSGGYMVSAISKFADYDNFTAMLSVVNAVTAAQKVVIGSSSYQLGYALGYITDYDNNVASTSAAHAMIATTIATFMAKLKDNVAGIAMAETISEFARSHNFAAMLSVVNSVTSAHKTSMGSSSSYLKTALEWITQHDKVGGSADNAEITTTITTFMAKLKDNVAGTAMADTIKEFAVSHNFTAMKVVVDSVIRGTTSPYHWTDTATITDLGTALNSIALYDNTLSSADDAAITAVVRNLMSKLSSNVPGAAIGSAVQAFAYSGNFLALDAVTDYTLTTSQKSAMNGSLALENALESLMVHDERGGIANDAAMAAVIRDFMSKLGAQVTADKIGDAIQQFAVSYNFAALDAVTDYLTDPQKSSLGNYSSLALSGALRAFIQYDATAVGDALVAAPLGDFMSKLGTQISVTTVGDAIEAFATSNNHQALSAMLDYTTLARIDAATKTALLAKGFTLYTDANESAAQIVTAAETSADGTTVVDATVVEQSENIIESSIAGTANTDKIIALGGIDTVHGNAGNDLIFGGSGNDVLYGDAGIDTILGGIGIDAIFGGTEGDTLYGNGENDVLRGDAGVDILWGGDGNDVLYGGTENDTLYGEAGNDVFRGEAGNDTLTGGAGLDRFIFDNLTTGGIDTIVDFSAAQDYLDVAAFMSVFNSNPANVITNFVKVSPVTGGSALLIDVDGAGAGAAVQVAVLKGLTWTSADIQALHASGHLDTVI